MPFKNRKQAALLLAERLKEFKQKNPLILAIPRGAVPMGETIADQLEGELDVVLVRKLGAPGQEELAIGAVDETGYTYLNPYAKELDISKTYLQDIKKQQLDVLRQRRQAYTPHRVPMEPKGRIVIVVDDGIATGSTMMAALHALRMRKPKKLIMATAVAPPSTIQKLKPLADQIVCLETPKNFYAVGQFFQDFSQTSDEEVMKILASSSYHPNTEVEIPSGKVTLGGCLYLPKKVSSVVIFAHGSGSSRYSPRNQAVAKVLQQRGMGTLLFDLLTPEEDAVYETRFNIDLLTHRLISATHWLARHSQDLIMGYFGASTGAAAALMAAAVIGDDVRAVVSRGGRPDMAIKVLDQVKSPTLLIVGGKDTQVLELNEKAYAALKCKKELKVVKGATHLFEEQGALEKVEKLAADWFEEYL